MANEHPPAQPTSPHPTVIEQTTTAKTDRIDLQADEIIYHEDEQKIIAKGNVELTRGGQILNADLVTYDLQADIAHAAGNVALLQENGDVHFAQRLRFQQKLKEGLVEGLYSYLAEGARLTASEAEQQDGGARLVMRNASYTPCIPCLRDENIPIKDQILSDDTPAWAIKAREVIHEKAEHKVVYRDAWFDFQGVPVFYTPYFSHPDGSIQQKSGFLTPSFGGDSRLGANITNRYYWAIDKDRDATFGALISSNEAPLLLGEYRQRFTNASIELSASGTISDRVDFDDGERIRRGESFRGHIFGEGIWDINKNWRAGFDIELTTDDQFLREYNITGEDVLETEAYVERFDNRDYFSVRGFGFIDTRVFAEDIDQPNIIPEITYSALGDPGSFLDGRLSFDASILGLRRNGEGQDLTRGILEGGWRKQTILPIGLVMDTHLLLRGDVYNIRDRDLDDLDPSLSDSKTELRGFSQLHNVFRYPFIKQGRNGQWVVEPMVALTVSPDISQDDDDIPNEDSQDIQLDIFSLFSENRFPGEDRLEDRSRVTYGVNSGYYFGEGSFARVFLGQSYTFNKDDIIFAEGSGLQDQSSDLVGNIGIDYKGVFDLEYGFQFDNDSLRSQRHELISSLTLDRLTLNSRYFYSRGLEDTSVDDNREQLRLASHLWLDPEKQWRLNSGFTHDFGVSEGLRRAFMGMDFTNECRCWTLSSSVVRNLANEASGEGGTEFLIQISFKNLGAFGNANLSSP